jgi:predicted nucleotide-binding protein
MALEAAIDEAVSAAFGHWTPAYNRYKDAALLDRGPHSACIGSTLGRGGSVNYEAREAQEARRYLAKGKEQSIALLRSAIRALEDEIADEEQSPQTDTARAAALPRDLSKVFVVHGRQEGPREAVGRFLERLGFEAIILHEQANQGRAVIEKIEGYSDVGFAVVLLIAGREGETPRPHARQNVMLELGYFIGKLTRICVCTLKVGELEIPSEWRGGIDEPFDSGGAWKQTLACELEAAGYDIDWNKVMRS